MSVSILNRIPSEIVLKAEALAGISASVVITDHMPHIIWANRAWTEMTGFTLEEALGKDPRDLVRSGRMQKGFYENMWQTISSGSVWKGRVTNKRKNGQLYTEIMTINPIISEMDGNTYYVAIKEDITLEEKLKSNFSGSEGILFEMSSNIITILDCNGNVKEINRKGAQILGFSEDEIRGKNWFDSFIPPIEKIKMKKVFSDLISGKKILSEQFENQVINKKGELLHISWSNRLLVNEEGNIDGVLSSGWDISDLVLKSKQIEQQNIFLSIEAGIGKIINQTGTYTEIIELLLDQLSKHSIVLTTWIAVRDLINNKIDYSQRGFDSDDFQKAIQALFNKKPSSQECNRLTSKFVLFRKDEAMGPSNCPFKLIEPDGIVTSWGFNLPGNKTGHVSVLFSGTIKISETEENIIRSIFNLIKLAIEKKIEEELRMAVEDKLKNTEVKQKINFQSNLSANYVTSPDGRILDCNNSFLKLLEIESLEEALECDTKMFYPITSNQAQFFEQVKKFRFLENSERVYLTKTGKQINVLENTIAHFDDEGNLLEIHGFLVDISELKTKENRLKEALEKAKESDRLKSAFLANISHEIRTPMNHIMGFAHVLQDDGIDSATRNELLKTIESSGDKLVKMIGDIIDLSKIDAGQLVLKSRFFFLNEMFHGILSEQKANLPESKSELKIECQNNLSEPLEIYADANRLQQVVGILVENAIKFSNRGKIVGSYSLINHKLTIKISDEGIGIKPADFRYIFQRFTRGGQQDFTNSGGTGLGLALAEQLIKLMGGEIKVESTFGLGSTFTVVVPEVFTKEELTYQKELFIKGGIMDNLKILIAEDDESNYQLLKILLKPLDAEVLRAWNGSDAIEMVRQNPDLSLILMDLKMPEMDGFLATREIKLLNPNIPIIAQTAYALVGDREKALEAGCDFYLTKPIDHHKLKDIITQAMMNRNK